MGYDLDRVSRMECPCGNGQIIEGYYSNDWFQSYENHSIDCDECREKYHIEELGWYKSDGEYRKSHYLVPNGETIKSSCSRAFNTLETPFYEILCMFNEKSSLENGYEVLKDAKYYSRLEDGNASNICTQGKKYLGTVKPKVITPHVLEAIEKYDSVADNYERYAERSKADKARIVDVKSRSIGLHTLNEIK